MKNIRNISMIDYKKHIDEYKDFPIDGINYLDLNPLYIEVAFLFITFK